MDAIILSGGTPLPGEPLYDFTQGQPKALIDICGKPMVQWVLDALEKSRSVDQVVLVGLPQTTNLASTKIKEYLPSQLDMLENVRSGVRKILELNPEAKHVLVVSSDIPAITPEIVDWVVQTATDPEVDIYYNIITRQVMETRFPDSKRSYTRLQDYEVCGGDVNVVRTITVSENDELYKKVLAARKNVFKQASLIGYGTLLLLILRRIDVDSAVKRVCTKLNIKGQAVLCPYAEVGMDVDKPHQLEILRRDLAEHVTA